jgi:hypothetical protein
MRFTCTTWVCVKGGVNFANLGGSEVQSIVESKTGVASFETDIKSLLPGKDFGGVVGASARILVANVDVRYAFGMKTTTSGFPSSTYNRVWSVMLEIPF